jgi:hypothetical protein
MFAGKVGGYPSEAPFRCPPLGSLTHKHQAWLKGLARDKHFGLIRKFVNFGQKVFMTSVSGFEPSNLGSLLLYRLGNHPRICRYGLTLGLSLSESSERQIKLEDEDGPEKGSNCQNPE